jgi:hypothetical protein
MLQRVNRIEKTSKSGLYQEPAKKIQKGRERNAGEGKPGGGGRGQGNISGPGVVMEPLADSRDKNPDRQETVASTHSKQSLPILTTEITREVGAPQLQAYC